MRQPSPSEIGAATALATMGALPLGTPPQDPERPDETSPIAYAIGAIGGASIGGGLVGLVAGGDLRGAATGALITGGLASVADGLALVRQGGGSKTLGAVLGVGGLMTLATALFLAATRHRRES